MVDETHVSNVYVHLGNDFNAAVAAFSSFGIDMRCVQPFDCPSPPINAPPLQ